MITSTSATDLISQPQPIPNLKPGTRVTRSQNQWKALLEEFTTSGLSKSTFCKQHRIATSSLYRWQRIFAERAGEVTDFIDVTQPLSGTPLPPSASARDNDWQVELELGPGVVLRLRTT
jgi:hypothetical protein